MSAKERSELFRNLFKTRIASGKGPQGKAGQQPKLPNYRLIQSLGKGGMASVYQAEKISTGRQVALKIIADQISDHTDWIERFLIEAENLASLSHSNIVPVFDWGTFKGTSFIEMEWMKGGDLHAWFQSHVMTIGDVVTITAKVASGLDFAGAKGYVHRDIKPDNILFREDGTPCISDFGIAKKMESNTTISSQGMVIGTGAYLSPEQANPKGRDLDQRSDLYSLGILFYEMLTGDKPFKFEHSNSQESFLMYLNAHINLPPPPLESELAVFQPIMDKLLAKEPEDRFARGQELVAALAQLERTVPAEVLSLPAKPLQKTTESNPVDLPTKLQSAAQRPQSDIGVAQVSASGEHQTAIAATGMARLTATALAMVNNSKTAFSAFIHSKGWRTKGRYIALGVVVLLIAGPLIIALVSQTEPNSANQTQGTANITSGNNSEATTQNQEVIRLTKIIQNFGTTSPEQRAARLSLIEASQALLIAEPSNPLAAQKLNQLLASQLEFVQHKLDQRQLDDIDQDLELLTLLDIEQGSRLSAQYQSLMASSPNNLARENLTANNAEGNLATNPQENEVPATYHLTINTEPANARVYLMGIADKYQSGGVDLAPGIYKVKAKADGYQDALRTIDLSDGDLVKTIRMRELYYQDPNADFVLSYTKKCNRFKDRKDLPFRCDHAFIDNRLMLEVEFYNPDTMTDNLMREDILLNVVLPYCIHFNQKDADGFVNYVLRSKSEYMQYSCQNRVFSEWREI